VSALPAAHPYSFFEPMIQGMINGRVSVQGFPAA
jgi:hypothetical protein